MHEQMNEPFSFVGENLVKHLTKTAEYAREFGRPNYLKVVSNRLCVASCGRVNINDGKIGQLIQNTALFHDMGKAADCYQIQFESGKIPEKPKFFLHEIPSAIICNRISKVLALDQQENFLLGFTVLNHMNAMRPLVKMKELLLDNWIPYHKEGWTFSRYGASLATIFGKIGISDLRPFLLPVNRTEAEDYLSKVENIASDRNNGWVRLYCLLLAPLIVGDNLSARQRNDNRLENASRMKFIQELEETVRIFERN
jgi:CRISPR/Cas system-associated endonuclease Cas3-HD